MPPATIVVYGIKNCDSVKKTRSWLEQQATDYRFHDYRIDGLDNGLLQQFIDQLGFEAILNRRSSSWRQLSESQKNDLTTEKAMQLMLETPTLIKRPIIAAGTQFSVGFNPEHLASLL